MQSKFVRDTEADWDQWLPYLLFACREVAQTSLGYPLLNCCTTVMSEDPCPFWRKLGKEAIRSLIPRMLLSMSSKWGKSLRVCHNLLRRIWLTLKLDSKLGMTKRRELELFSQEIRHWWCCRVTTVSYWLNGKGLLRWFRNLDLPHMRLPFQGRSSPCTWSSWTLPAYFIQCNFRPPAAFIAPTNWSLRYLLPRSI